MRTVLFCWELGGGLGHLLQLRPLVLGLREAGHRVVLCVRDLESAADVFGGGGIVLIQAPHSVKLPRNPIKSTLTFPHLLHNVGWHRMEHLRAIAGAWRTLFRMLKPNLIVCDHSPSALLGARGLGVPVVVVGSGFCIPPDQYPLPTFRPTSIDSERIRADEHSLLRRINEVLRPWKAPELERIGQLYSETSDQFLMTFRDLDHYGERSNARYRGPVNGEGGVAPQWPKVGGKRVFAYLKNFSGVEKVMEGIMELGVAAVVYGPELPVELVRAHRSESVHFEKERLDAGRCAGECDMAITNAGHGVTAELLMAGRPMVCIPLAVEQDITARIVEAKGMGVRVGAEERQTVKEKVGLVLGSSRFQEAAERAAMRVRGFDATEERRAMVGRLCELVD